MAKGNIAKENVAQKIIEIFGDNYIDTVDKKIYVYADDGGEQVQIAISLTCPKTGIAAKGDSSPALSGVTEPTPASAAPTEEEQAAIDDLFARLGL